MRKNFIEIHKT